MSNKQFIHPDNVAYE